MDLITALQMAIEEELKASAKYREMAAQADDPETRIMLEQIAREEESHYKRLVDRLKTLKLMRP